MTNDTTRKTQFETPLSDERTVLGRARARVADVAKLRRDRIESTITLEKTRLALKRREAALALSNNEAGDPLISGKNEAMRAAQLRELCEFDAEYSALETDVETLSKGAAALAADLETQTDYLRLDRLELLLMASPAVVEAVGR